MEEFSRIQRLPPYVFAVVGDLKMKLRRQNIDIVDFSMGNPDIPTPPYIVDKLVEAVQKPVNHRYSLSRGIPICAMPCANATSACTTWISIPTPKPS